MTNRFSCSVSADAKHLLRWGNKLFCTLLTIHDIFVWSFIDIPPVFCFGRNLTIPGNAMKLNDFSMLYFIYSAQQETLFLHEAQ